MHHNEGRFYTLRFICSALAFGTIFWVLLTATIILAVSALPKANADSDSTTQIAQGVLIVSASLLPTVPLLEWWYNGIRRVFRIFFD